MARRTKRPGRFYFCTAPRSPIFESPLCGFFRCVSHCRYRNARDFVRALRESIETVLSSAPPSLRSFWESFADVAHPTPGVAPRPAQPMPDGLSVPISHRILRTFHHWLAGASSRNYRDAPLHSRTRIFHLATRGARSVRAGYRPQAHPLVLCCPDPLTALLLHCAAARRRTGRPYPRVIASYCVRRSHVYIQ